MENWVTIRKGSVHIYVEYDHTHTGNLSADNIRIRIDPPWAVRLDLNGNLRKRSKTTNTYMDARALSDGGLSTLILVQVDDPLLVKGIQEAWKSDKAAIPDVTLTIDLEGEKIFEVVPRIVREAYSLQLTVKSVEQKGLGHRWQRRTSKARPPET